MKNKLIDTLLENAVSAGKEVEEYSKAPEIKKAVAPKEDGADAIHLDDFAFGADGHSHAIVTHENIGRLAKQGFVKYVSKSGKGYSTLKESIEDAGDAVILEAETGYADNKSGHFKIDLSKHDAGSLHGHVGDDEVDANVTDAGDHYLVKSKTGEDVHKVEKTVQFKLSRGNVKVGGNTVILNMSSAKDCMSAILGLCELYAKGQCYAVNGEYRDTVLSAKRMQGISFKKLASQNKLFKHGEFAIENTALGLGILTTIASLPTWKNIKYVRLNESGDFRDGADSGTLEQAFNQARANLKGILDVIDKKAKKQKLNKEETEIFNQNVKGDATKYMSSGKYLNTLEQGLRKKLHDAMAFPDTLAVQHILETWKACVAHGTKFVFEQSMGAVEDFGVSTDELFERCDHLVKMQVASEGGKPVKGLAVYTYTHRTDLESKLAQICNTHPNFSLNGSLKRFNPTMNMFRAVDYDVFTTIFGEGRDNANKGHVIAKNMRTLSPEAQTAIKPYLTDSEINGTVSEGFYPCKQSCRICDFCKTADGKLIFIPIHGSGTKANTAEKEINALVKEVCDEAMEAVNSDSEEYGDMGELINTYHTATNEKDRDTAKNTIQTKYFPKMFERFVMKSNNTKANVNTVLGAFNALVHDTDRFDRFFDALVSGGSTEIFEIVKGELATQIEKNHPTMSATRMAGAMEAIKQTYQFLNPESEGLKAIQAHIEEFEQTSEQLDDSIEKLADKGGDDLEAVKKATAPLLSALDKMDTELKKKLSASSKVTKGNEGFLSASEKRELNAIILKLDLEKKFLQGIHNTGLVVDRDGIAGKADKLEKQAKNSESVGDKASAQSLRKQAYKLVRDAGDELVQEFSKKFSLIGDVDKSLSAEANLFVEKVANFANKIHTAKKVGSAVIWYQCLRDIIAYLGGEKSELTKATRGKLGSRFKPKAMEGDTGLSETIITFNDSQEQVIEESQKLNQLQRDFEIASSLID